MQAVGAEAASGGQGDSKWGGTGSVHERNQAGAIEPPDAVSAVGELLLFRAVADPARRTMVTRMVDHGVGGSWRRSGETDLWELHDAGCGSDDTPVAVAATRPLGDGRRVRLVAVVVAVPLRGQGLGRRIIEELADALRARGVLVLVAAVASDDPAGIVVVQRSGLRPSHVERASAETDGRDLVWFDLEL